MMAPGPSHFVDVLMLAWGRCFAFGTFHTAYMLFHITLALPDATVVLEPFERWLVDSLLS